MWTCPLCQFATAAAVRHPVRCRCGFVDAGDQTQARRPRWISSTRRLAAVEKLLAKLPLGITAVAGVPRSGMMPAGMIAERLHLPLYEAVADGLRELGHGGRFRPAERAGITLVVDDTVASGYSLARTKSALSAPHITAVLFCSPQCRERVNWYAEVLPLPHYLEWNLFNSIHSPTLATDIDGVLCPDPPPGLNDCAYEHWLQNAPTLQRPVRDVLPLIATGRRRLYRRHTERWLAERGIRCERLVFPGTEIEWANPGLLKADAYAASSATVFVESDPAQARLIAERTGKRVICPAAEEVLN